MSRVSWSLGVLILSFLPIQLATSAIADAGSCIDSESQADAFYVALQCGSPAGGSPPVTPAATGPFLPPEVADLAACFQDLLGAHFLTDASCLFPQAPDGGEPGPAETMNAMMLEAVRRVRPPALEVIVQPPGGRTLVNLDTIFLAEAETVTRPVRLLGRQVLLRITPSRFTWVHGDGSRQVTREPGRRFEPGLPMDAYVTHRYLDAHESVHPRVDVGYTAMYSLDSGATWRDVIGVVTIAGPEAELRVVEARPVLVGTD